LKQGRRVGALRVIAQTETNPEELEKQSEVILFFLKEVFKNELIIYVFLNLFFLIRSLKRE